MDIDSNAYTIKDLRNWLKELNLPMNGNKSALVLRLNEVPQEIRGICPSKDVDEDAEELPIDDSIQSDNSTNSREVELLKRELALIEREKSLLKHENSVLKNEISNQSSNAQVSKQNNNFNFATIKDFLPEYDGNGNVELWAAQLQDLCTKFELKEESMKALLVCKMKAAAQNWLYAKSNYMSVDTQALLTELKNAFKTPGSKLAQRRKFENRKWTQGERFSEYFNDKIKLASNFQFEESELVEYLVEGINNYHLRTQATIQCFGKSDGLLRAFANIEVPKMTPSTSSAKATTTTTTTKSNVRCYNCNSMGHFASECRKPKRELGTCYDCGSRDHMLPACPLRKNVHMVNDVNHIQEAQ